MTKRRPAEVAVNANTTAPLDPEGIRRARSTIDAAPVGELSRGFLALGNPIRLATLLAVAGRELCVADLTRLFPVTQGAVSQHPRRLREVGLVTTRRTRKNVYYRLHEEHTTALLNGGLRHLAKAKSAVAAGEPAAGTDGREE